MDTETPVSRRRGVRSVAACRGVRCLGTAACIRGCLSRSWGGSGGSISDSSLRPASEPPCGAGDVMPCLIRCPPHPPVSCPSLVCSQARNLALSNEYAGENLIPLLSCASRVSRAMEIDGQRSVEGASMVQGKLFVGQVWCLLGAARAVDHARSGLGRSSWSLPGGANPGSILARALPRSRIPPFARGSRSTWTAPSSSGGRTGSRASSWRGGRMFVSAGLPCLVGPGLLRVESPIGAMGSPGVGGVFLSSSRDHLRRGAECLAWVLWGMTSCTSE